jgi:multisubunit Na+/H+ antiporter MnhB subunit
MGTDDKQHQFDQIVARLTADYPSLAGGRRWSRRVVIVAAVLGGIVWGLLSVAMVAWGAPGVVLTCCVVAAVALTLIVDSYRRRGR